jgi:hypothetical protein
MLHRLRLLLLISLLQESIEGSSILCKCAEGQENEFDKSSGSEKFRFKMHKR